jgi:hypothetical protein
MPASPAPGDVTLSGQRKARLRFYGLAVGLRVPNLAISGSELSMVSGQYLKYSRFEERMPHDPYPHCSRGSRQGREFRLRHISA